MNLVVLFAACLGLAIVAALGLRTLRSRTSECDDMRYEYVVETKKAANRKRRFPYFG
jgi:hypothetical protein